MVPYFFLQMKSRWLQSLGAMVLCAVFAFSFCRILGSGERMEQQIQEVFESIPVRCAVTNPTGTQTAELNISYDLVRLFFSEDDATADFRSYIQDIQATMPLNCYSPQGSSQLFGITSVSAVSEWSGLEWKPGYNEDVFNENAFYCIVPRGMDVESLTLSFSGDNRTPLTIPGIYQQEFTVVATHNGSSFYCPWDAAMDLSLSFWGSAKADSIRATIADNTKLQEFRDLAGRYLPEPSRSPQTSQRFALAIYDDTLIQTVHTLRQNRIYLDMCLAALLVISFGIGLVFSFLCLRSKAKELWLLYVLGVPQVRIFATSMLEQGILSLLGICIGCIVASKPPHTGILTAFWGIYMAGTALSYWATMRKQFLQTGPGGM